MVSSRSINLIQKDLKSSNYMYVYSESKYRYRTDLKSIERDPKVLASSPNYKHDSALDHIVTSTISTRNINRQKSKAKKSQKTIMNISQISESKDCIIKLLGQKIPIFNRPNNMSVLSSKYAKDRVKSPPMPFRSIRMPMDPEIRLNKNILSLDSQLDILKQIKVVFLLLNDCCRRKSILRIKRRKQG